MSGQELRFPPDGARLREVRASVRRMAAAAGAAPEVCDNLALVVDELANNAIEHGAAYRRSGSDLRVRVDHSGDRLAIEFFDTEMPDDEVDELARAIATTTDGMPSLESERGRGLFLLTVYLSDLSAERAVGGGLRLVGYIASQ
ncbi:MAG TPA: ATP-binding protein [bacterium]|nr:ATP-binding protein [bacterium]